MKEKSFTTYYEEQKKLFGERVRQIRKHRKLTQIDLEVATGIYTTEISKIENGFQNFEFATLIKLAMVLDVPLSVLIDYDGPLPDNTNFKSRVIKK
jgi:transcriptional regulator with XRE-family HTH domain